MDNQPNRIKCSMRNNLTARQASSTMLELLVDLFGFSLKRNACNLAD